MGVQCMDRRGALCDHPVCVDARNGVTTQAADSRYSSFEVATQPPDPTNPPYYTAGGYETRKVAKAFGFDAYLFNAFKYMCRGGKKSPDAVTDLRKAIRMIEFRIEELTEGKGP